MKDILLSLNVSGMRQHNYQPSGALNCFDTSAIPNNGDERRAVENAIGLAWQAAAVSILTDLRSTDINFSNDHPILPVIRNAFATAYDKWHEVYALNAPEGQDIETLGETQRRAIYNNSNVHIVMQVSHPAADITLVNKFRLMAYTIYGNRDAATGAVTHYHTHELRNLGGLNNILINVLEFVQKQLGMPRWAQSIKPNRRGRGPRGFIRNIEAWKAFWTKNIQHAIQYRDVMNKLQDLYKFWQLGRMDPNNYNSEDRAIIQRLRSTNTGDNEETAALMEGMAHCLHGEPVATSQSWGYSDELLKFVTIPQSMAVVAPLRTTEQLHGLFREWLTTQITGLENLLEARQYGVNPMVAWQSGCRFMRMIPSLNVNTNGSVDHSRHASPEVLRQLFGDILPDWFNFYPRTLVAPAQGNYYTNGVYPSRLCNFQFFQHPYAAGTWVGVTTLLANAYEDFEKLLGYSPGTGEPGNEPIAMRQSRLSAWGASSALRNAVNGDTNRGRSWNTSSVNNNNGLALGGDYHHRYVATAFPIPNITWCNTCSRHYHVFSEPVEAGQQRDNSVHFMGITFHAVGREDNPLPGMDVSPNYMCSECRSNEGRSSIRRQIVLLVDASGHGAAKYYPRGIPSSNTTQYVMSHNTDHATQRGRRIPISVHLGIVGTQTPDMVVNNMASAFRELGIPMELVDSWAEDSGGSGRRVIFNLGSNGVNESGIRNDSRCNIVFGYHNGERTANMTHVIRWETFMEPGHRILLYGSNDQVSATGHANRANQYYRHTNGRIYMSLDDSPYRAPIYLTHPAPSTRFLERAVGIEFETGSGIIDCCATFLERMAALNLSTPAASWCIKTDGSLASSAREVVTPPMRGHAIDLAIGAYYDLARELGFVTESSRAGGHIHTEATDIFEMFQTAYEQRGTNDSANVRFTTMKRVLGRCMQTSLLIAREFVSAARRNNGYCSGMVGVRSSSDLTHAITDHNFYDGGVLPLRGNTSEQRHGLEIQWRNSVQGGNSCGGNVRRATNYTLEYRIWPSSASPFRVKARAELSQKLTQWTHDQVAAVFTGGDSAGPAVERAIATICEMVPTLANHRGTRVNRRKAFVRKVCDAFNISPEGEKALTSIHQQFFGPTYNIVMQGGEEPNAPEERTEGGVVDTGAPLPHTNGDVSPDEALIAAEQ